MKAIVLVLVVSLSLVGGAAGGLFMGALDSGTPAGAAALRPEPESARSSDVGAEFVTELRREVGDLRLKVAALENELTTLLRSRTGIERTREPIDEGLEVASFKASSMITPSDRAKVLQIIEDDRLRRDEERKAEQARREEAKIRNRATALSKKLGLAIGSENTLTSVFMEERAKQSAIYNDLKGANDARELIKTAMRDVRDWRTAQLTSYFGADVAQKVNESESEPQVTSMRVPSSRVNAEALKKLGYTKAGRKKK